MCFLDKLKGFLLKPNEAFVAYKNESLGKAYQYYIILLVIFSVLYGIVEIATGMNSLSQMATLFGNLFGTGYGDAILAFGGFIAALDFFFIYLTFVLGLFTIFLSGFILHCFVLMFDGEKGFEMTLKSMFYANTPALLLGWIPFVNIIALIWTLVLQIIGIKTYHEISTGKAVMVVILPIILVSIGMILFSVVIAAFFTGILEAGGIIL